MLLKNGRLTADERVREIVRHHHERLDGSGYPDALRGDAIPLVAQIVAIVDVFDALTTERPYQPAYSVARAVEELRADVHVGWRRGDLVEEFIAILTSLLDPLRGARAAARS